jgi:hypothetical protein
MIHVPVPPHLRLDPWAAHVPEYLALADPALRLRKSAERDGYYVLERRARRMPACNAGLGDHSDLHIQARDGYIHVSIVHWQWLTRPWNILRELREEGEDLFVRGAAKLSDELEYEEAWAHESRRRRRRGLYRDIAVDAYDPLERLAGSRISNAGMPTA